MVCLAAGFRNVEATGETQKFIRCLVAIDEIPDFRVYKEASIDGLGLAASAQVADVALRRSKLDQRIIRDRFGHLFQVYSFQPLQPPLPFTVLQKR